MLCLFSVPLLLALHNEVTDEEISLVLSKLKFSKFFFVRKK